MNMNEEWFGVVALSADEKVSGLDKRIPRLAYYVIRDFWKNPGSKFKIPKLKTGNAMKKTKFLILLTTIKMFINLQLIDNFINLEVKIMAYEYEDDDDGFSDDDDQPGRLAENHSSCRAIHSNPIPTAHFHSVYSELVPCVIDGNRAGTHNTGFTPAASHQRGVGSHAAGGRQYRVERAGYLRRYRKRGSNSERNGDNGDGQGRLSDGGGNAAICHQDREVRTAQGRGDAADRAGRAQVKPGRQIAADEGLVYSPKLFQVEPPSVVLEPPASCPIHIVPEMF
jgi:hypothetical protein